MLPSLLRPLPQYLRNIAIIAHVDHGKTTLVNQLLQQTSQQKFKQRAMDSNVLEIERGITILSKTTSIMHKDTRINIVDTPGHADFGGEVERILSMVDGVALIVDATEGPMTQTRFVLKKALERRLKTLVVMNKADRDTAQPDRVDSDIMDLFATLAPDQDLDYPLLYASAKQGWADDKLPNTETTMKPLLDLICDYIPHPDVDQNAPFKMLITQIENDPFLGILYLGKVQAGAIKLGDKIRGIDSKSQQTCEGKVSRIFRRVGMEKIPIEEAVAGEIVSIAGFDGGAVSNTLCDQSVTEPIKSVELDPPTISIHVGPNDSPLGGTEGNQLTSTAIRARCQREALSNVSLHVLPSYLSSEQVELRGRGVLHLGILLETLRREGFELSVSPPTAVMKKEDGVILEPIEEVTIEVGAADAGQVIEKLTKRKAELKSYDESDSGRVKIVMDVPARGLLGYVAGEFKNDTHGTGVLNHIFKGYEKYRGSLETTRKGAIISSAQGESKAYALKDLEARGTMFVGHGDKVYAGMVIGECSKDGDLEVNPVKSKALTNMRAAGKDDDLRLTPAKSMSLEETIAYIESDEIIELTPKSVRLRKSILDSTKRKMKKKSAADGQMAFA